MTIGSGDDVDRLALNPNRVDQPFDEIGVEGHGSDEVLVMMPDGEKIDGRRMIRVFPYKNLRHWTCGVSVKFRSYRWQTGYMVPFSIGLALGPFYVWFDFAERDYDE